MAQLSRQYQTAVFRKEVNDIIQNLDEANKIRSQIGKKKGKEVIDPVSKEPLSLRGSFNPRMTQIRTQLRALTKLYKEGLVSARKTGRRVTSGFRLPIYVDQTLVNFFCDPRANLGPRTEQLKSTLAFLQKAIPSPVYKGRSAPAPTATSLLSPLFAIYAHENNLAGLAAQNVGVDKSSSDFKGQWLGSDALMEQYFGPVSNPSSVYGIVLKRSEENLKALNLTDGGVKAENIERRRRRYEEAYREKVSLATLEGKTAPVQKPFEKGERVTDNARLFNPSKMLYYDFQSIVSASTIKPVVDLSGRKRLPRPNEESRGRIKWDEETLKLMDARIDRLSVNQRDEYQKEVNSLDVNQAPDFMAIVQSVAARTGGLTEPLYIRGLIDRDTYLVSQISGSIRTKLEQERQDKRRKSKKTKAAPAAANGVVAPIA